MKKLFFILVLVIPVVGNAQKIKLLSGNLKSLKGVKSLNVEFNYDSMFIGGDSKTEEAFVTEKKNNWDQKEPGKGSEWEKHWVDSKKLKSEPSFKYVFGKNAGVKVDPSAPHTLVLKVKRLHTGFNVGMAADPALLYGEAWIVDSADRDKVLAKINLEKFRGDVAGGDDFKIGERINQVYVATAEKLGLYLKEKALN